MLTVKEINEISFGKAGFSGYKPEDVDNFIDEVVESFQQLQSERDAAVKQAEELAALLKGSLCHVNLIPVNYVKEAGYRQSGRAQIYAFQKVLCSRGVNATVRRTLGADINAACGQLRREAENGQT